MEKRKERSGDAFQRNVFSITSLSTKNIAFIMSLLDKLKTLYPIVVDITHIQKGLVWAQSNSHRRI